MGGGFGVGVRASWGMDADLETWVWDCEREGMGVRVSKFHNDIYESLSDVRSWKFFLRGPRAVAGYEKRKKSLAIL